MVTIKLFVDKQRTRLHVEKKKKFGWVTPNKPVKLKQTN